MPNSTTSLTRYLALQKPRKPHSLQYLEELSPHNSLPKLATNWKHPLLRLNWQGLSKTSWRGEVHGPDGFTNAYYFTRSFPVRYVLILTPWPQVLVLPRRRCLPTLRSSPRKERFTLSKNYRPISLLNTDIKILAGILANCLKPILPTVVHPDQTGFIAGREARDKFNRAIQQIYGSDHKPTIHPVSCFLQMLKRHSIGYTSGRYWPGWA